LPQTSAVTLKVYNLIGEEIKTLIDEERNAGRHKIIFNSSGLSSCVYLYKITTGYYSETKKLILMK
jgi:hypothetical protein